MASVEEVTEGLADANAALEQIDQKLDEVKAFIATLKGPVSQEQLDQIAALVSSVKEKSQAVLSETDALDETPSPA